MKRILEISEKGTLEKAPKPQKLKKTFYLTEEAYSLVQEVAAMYNLTESTAVNELILLSKDIVEKTKNEQKGE